MPQSKPKKHPLRDEDRCWNYLLNEKGTQRTQCPNKAVWFYHDRETYGNDPDVKGKMETQLCEECYNKELKQEHDNEDKTFQSMVELAWFSRERSKFSLTPEHQIKQW